MKGNAMESIWRSTKLFYRPSEVAEVLCCHRDTVYELVKLGELLCHNRQPGRSGMQIIGTSIEAYVSRYILPAGHVEFEAKKQGKGVVA